MTRKWSGFGSYLACGTNSPREVFCIIDNPWWHRIKKNSKFSAPRDLDRQEYVHLGRLADYCWAGRERGRADLERWWGFSMSRTRTCPPALKVAWQPCSQRAVSHLPHTGLSSVIPSSSPTSHLRLSNGCSFHMFIQFSTPLDQHTSQ